MYKHISLFMTFIFSVSCIARQSTTELKNVADNTFTNPIKERGLDPWAISHKGVYYYMETNVDRLVLLRCEDMIDLESASKREITLPAAMAYMTHIWSPEIHFLNGKWYIYFAADDGNTDNHQIYVAENPSEDPFDGEFVMKGRVRTDRDDNWAIHATVFEVGEQFYMAWSGWQTRRVGAETQCIYIAKMENPWTLKSERVLLSTPEYEWERQWINPDGSRTSYPIFVNEAPQATFSKNGDYIVIYYSASGRWTPYYAVGRLSAKVGSNLLDPMSWSKSKVPLFSSSPENRVYAPGNISFIPSPDGVETYLLYHAREVPNEPSGGVDSQTPRMQKVEWDEDGMQLFGVPGKLGQELAKPSGTK